MYTENGINGPCGRCEHYSDGFTAEQKATLHPTAQFRATKEYNDGWCRSMKGAVKKRDGCDTRPRKEIFEYLESRGGRA